MRIGGLALARHRVVSTRRLPAAVLARLDRFFEVADAEGGLRGASALLVDPGVHIDAALLRDLPLLRAVCTIGPAQPGLDLATMTRAGVIATDTPALDDCAAAGVAAENLIAAFGFGRLGGHPPNLLNRELACMACCL